MIPEHWVDEESSLTWEGKVNQFLIGKSLKEASYSNQTVYLKFGSEVIAFATPKQVTFLEESIYYSSDVDYEPSMWLDYVKNKTIGKSLIRIVVTLNDVVTLLFNYPESPLVRNNTLTLSYSDMVMLIE